MSKLSNLESQWSEFDQQVEMLSKKLLGAMKRSCKFNELEQPEHRVERIGIAVGSALKTFCSEQQLSSGEMAEIIGFNME